MSDRKYMMGLFAEEHQTVSALNALKRSQWTIERVHSPVPSHKIIEALRRPKSKVGYFTLMGGIVGFFAGIGLAVYTAVQWNLVVSGKPIVAMVPFFIVGFEFTVLFAVFGNIIGLLTQARLPRFKDLAQHDPRCTGDRFGILVSCVRGQEPKLSAFFKETGAEAKTFD